MDDKQFDQLTRTIASETSRRRMLQGMVGGALSGLFAQVRSERAVAQCSWSGTFTSSLGGITMTLTEAASQVNGTYTFTDNNAITNGTVSGVVRAEFPGYTVIDGYWREPGEGGRVWFVMPLETCAQFTGSYTGTDTVADWIAGWDGVRTGGEVSAGNVEITVFSNPGDSALARVTENGESFTVFGSRDAEGLPERVSQVVTDSPDGDPQRQVFLDFADDGKLVRGALASGETMLFDWVAPTRVIVTYRSADGSQEAQVPVDAEVAASAAARSVGETALLAYSGRSDIMSTLAEPAAAIRTAQPSREGTIRVQCGSGAPVDTTVQATYWKTDTPKTGPGSEFAFQQLPLNHVAAGVFTYKLPLAPAPASLPSGKVATVLWTAVEVLCVASTSSEAALLTEGVICGAVTKIAALAGVSCGVIMYAYNKVCNVTSVSWPGSSIKSYIDNYSQGYEVYAYAVNYDKRITVFVTPAEIPTGVINVGGEATLSPIATDPSDPAPNQGYTISVGTYCVPNGAQLAVNVVGTDGYTSPPHSVTISDTVSSTQLPIPGGGASVQDTITATVTQSGGVVAVAQKTIVF